MQIIYDIYALHGPLGTEILAILFAHLDNICHIVT